MSIKNPKKIESAGQLNALSIENVWIRSNANSLKWSNSPEDAMDVYIPPLPLGAMLN